MDASIPDFYMFLPQSSSLTKFSYSEFGPSRFTVAKNEYLPRKKAEDALQHSPKRISKQATKVLFDKDKEI